MDIKNFFLKKYDENIVNIKSKQQQLYSKLLSLFQHQHQQQQQNSNPLNNQQETFSLISNFESQLIQLQALLIWEKPENTIVAMAMFTCFYWTIVLWQPRLISILASLAFCYHFYEMWIRYVWPEIRAPSVPITESWTAINPNVMSAPEIKLYFKQLYETYIIKNLHIIIEFRKNNHGKFCFIMIMILSIVYYLGHLISGALFTYFLAMILFLIPGILTRFASKNNHLIDIRRHQQQQQQQQGQSTLMNSSQQTSSSMASMQNNNYSSEMFASNNDDDNNTMNTILNNNNIINDYEMNENYFNNNNNNNNQTNDINDDDDKDSEEEQSMHSDTSDFVIISDIE